MRTIRLRRPALAVGIAAAGAVATAGPAGYVLFFRRRCLTWGARDDEVAAKLPGDELLPDAGLVTTRAVTIDAPPEAIWPWLVQMGSGRGGAYTYDWIENLLGLNMHSADEILPQYQHIAVGDELPMGPGRPGMTVEVLDPPRTLAVRVADQNWVWIFALVPEGESTRLISRNRIATAALAPVGRLFYTVFMEPGSLVMERKMLLGIKQRAERTAAAQVQLTAGMVHRHVAESPAVTQRMTILGNPAPIPQPPPPGREASWARPHRTTGQRSRHAAVGAYRSLAAAPIMAPHARARATSPSRSVSFLLTRKLSGAANIRQPWPARSLEMPRLARPVNSGTPLSLVSKATARVFCPPRLPTPSSQPRTPGPSASGSMVSPLSRLRAASAAQRREAAVDMRCRCVGPPTTSRSAAATSSGVVRVTGTSVTSCLVLARRRC